MYNLDDINNYQIIIVSSARKLAEASLNVILRNLDLDDINNYRTNIVFLTRKLAEASLDVV